MIVVGQVIGSLLDVVRRDDNDGRSGEVMSSKMRSYQVMSVTKGSVKSCHIVTKTRSGHIRIDVRVSQ